MFYPKKIVGKYVILRSVDVDDALFTLEIRNDEKLTKYLPKLNISLEQQVAWIKKQKNLPGDYLFVVERPNGEKIGVLGIYDIVDGTGETGRLAIVGNPLENLEAQYLSFVFAFNTLGLDSTHCFIYDGNTNAKRLSLFFGTTFSDLVQDEKGTHGYKGLLTKQSFFEYEPRVKRMLHL